MEVYEIVAVGVLIILTIVFIVKAVIEERGEIKNWLLIAVEQAEKKLGAGTGQKKLKMVYTMFMERFPVMSVFFSFETFSKWVDIALEQMKEALENSGKEKDNGEA